MATQYLRGQPERENSGNQVFERMSILSSQSNGSFELMVLVVDALVEWFEVEQAVGVVEDYFAAEDTEDDVADDFREARDIVAEVVEGWTTQKMQNPEFEDLCCCHEYYYVYAMPYLNGRWC
jgi:hypothetical protein